MLEVDFWIFDFFPRFYHFLSKIRHFERKTAKSRTKIKNSKIYFQHFLGPMVLHNWSKFHVSTLIFEREDLFKLILRKMLFCEKWAFLTIFSSNFQNLNISTHETYWNMYNLIESKIRQVWTVRDNFWKFWSKMVVFCHITPLYFVWDWVIPPNFDAELMMYTKFQKLLLTGCIDMDKNKKIPSKWGFPPFVTPQECFSKIWLCHFCTLMDRLTGRWTRAITMDPIG